MEYFTTLGFITQCWTNVLQLFMDYSHWTKTVLQLKHLQVANSSSNNFVQFTHTKGRRKTKIISYQHHKS